MTRKEIKALFSGALGFEGLPESAYETLAAHSFIDRIAKDGIIFGPGEVCNAMLIVAEGMVRVSICSVEGNRITYLLAVKGEPLNLVGPFTGQPRLISAEAVKYTVLVGIKRSDFTAIAFSYPQLVTNLIHILGNSVDSANSRILDMLEKKVDQRVRRILNTLYKKFGPTLKFTGNEIAELACTTTESSLRALGKLRKEGVIETGRMYIKVLEPRFLEQIDDDAIWL